MEFSLYNTEGTLVFRDKVASTNAGIQRYFDSVLESSNDVVEVSGVLFIDIDFAGIDITGVAFRGCIFRRCKFGTAKLTDCMFDVCKFNQTSFSGVLIDNFIASNTRFDTCVFSGMAINAATMELVLNFKKCELFYCHCVGGWFGGIDIQESLIEETTFSKTVSAMCIITDTIVNKCNFTSCSLRMSEFLRSKFEGTSFRSADLYCSSLGSSEFDSCDFSDAILDSCGFSFVHLKSCTLPSGMYRNVLRSLLFSTRGHVSWFKKILVDVLYRLLMYGRGF